MDCGTVLLVQLQDCFTPSSFPKTSQELVREYSSTHEIHQLASSLLKTWGTTSLDLRPSIDAPAVGYWHATGGVAEEMWEWGVTLNEAEMERALRKAKTTVDEAPMRYELERTKLAFRKSEIEAEYKPSAERMQAFLQEMRAVFPKKVVAEEKIENMEELLEKHSEVVDALVQNKIVGGAMGK